MIDFCPRCIGVHERGYCPEWDRDLADHEEHCKLNWENTSAEDKSLIKENVLQHVRFLETRIAENNRQMGIPKLIGSDFTPSPSKDITKLVAMEISALMLSDGFDAPEFLEPTNTAMPKLLKYIHHLREKAQTKTFEYDKTKQLKWRKDLIK